MDITKAKEFLERQGLDDCHYQDSGMIEHIAEQMEMYHTEQLRLGAVIGRSEQLCDHPRGERSYIGQNMLRCNKCGKEFS